MIPFVIALNCAIAVLGFWLAWQIWRIKQVLTTATVVLTAWERQTRQVLNPETLPHNIGKGQQATVTLRNRYHRFQQQVHQLEKIFSISLVGLRLFSRHRRRR